VRYPAKIIAPPKRIWCYFPITKFAKNFSPQDFEDQAFQCFSSVLKIDPDHKKAKVIRRVSELAINNASLFYM
jgi:hypothetical protein